MSAWDEALAFGEEKKSCSAKVLTGGQGGPQLLFIPHKNRGFATLLSAAKPPSREGVPCEESFYNTAHSMASTRRREMKVVGFKGV